MKKCWRRLLLVFTLAFATVGATPAMAQEQPGAVSGRVFHDLDGDGVLDDREPGLAGARLLLKQQDLIVGEATSGMGGVYVLDGISPGEYVLSAELPDRVVDEHCLVNGSVFSPLPYTYCALIVTFPPWRHTTADAVSATVESLTTLEVDFGTQKADMVLMYGVALLEDDYAPKGTVIEAYVDDEVCGSTTVGPPIGQIPLTGPTWWFRLDIFGAGERPGCAMGGDHVQLTVGGVPADETLLWPSRLGGQRTLHLTAIEDHAWYWMESDGGDLPPDGAVVQAMVEGVVCGETAIQLGIAHPPLGDVAGFPRLIVPSEEIQPGCGRPGATVSFLVGGVEADTTVHWEPGLQLIDLVLLEQSTPTPIPILSGDVNCDATVDSIDAALILQYDAGLVDSLDCQDAADVNGDGTIDAVDAALTLQFSAGLIDSLPP